MWTPTELSLESRPAQGEAWRAVEAQHETATRAITDTDEEQMLLESLLEDSKPPYPPGCEHLNYLLKTPFRYGAPYPQGSRFRRAHSREGVFYGSETPRTALAELAFHRLMFFEASPGTPLPRQPTTLTVFSASYRTQTLLDLTKPPLERDEVLWRHPSDYRATQDLADQARRAGVQIIRYASIRDPESGHNLALLTPSAFASASPERRQTWQLLLRSTELAVWRPSGRGERFVFPRTLLQNDSGV